MDLMRCLKDDAGYFSIVNSNDNLRDSMEDNPQGSGGVTFDLAARFNSFTDATTRAY